MLPHQAQALAWVRSLASRGLGSILADEPGTGKVRERRAEGVLEALFFFRGDVGRGGGVGGGEGV